MSIRGYVIYNPKIPKIERFALNLINNSFNFDLTLYSGVYDNINEKISKFIWYNNKKIHKWRSIGVGGCFLSHYNLWEKSQKENVIMSIFEYDAELISPFDTNLISSDTDIIHLDYKSRTKNLFKVDESTPIITYPNSSIAGAHAYIVTPNGAKKLIDSVNKIGWMPVDLQINSKVVKIEVCNPPVARLNQKANKYVSETNSSKFN